MNIEWNRVTRFSQIIALLLFVVVFCLGIWLGMQMQKVSDENQALATHRYPH